MGHEGNRAAHADNDRRGLRYWHEWELNAGKRRIILCVATDLELRPGHPGFEPARLDKLVSEATELMRTSPSPIDAIRIVPER